MAAAVSHDPQARDDDCRYAFADEDEDEPGAQAPADGTQSELGDRGLTRQDSGRSMFTFATSTTDEKGGNGSSPCEPPGTHLDRTQSEPPGRYFSRGGYRSSPSRRRSSSPLPSARFPSVDGPLVRRSAREQERQNTVHVAPAVGREDKSTESNEVSRPLESASGALLSTRPSIDSFLELPALVGASSPADPSPPKPSTPNPVAALISDVIRNNDQEGEAQNHRAITPLLFPSKLRRDSKLRKHRPKQPPKGNPMLPESRDGQGETTPNPVALLVAEAIREKKVKRQPSPVRTRKPNPVALLVAEAVQKKAIPAIVGRATAGQPIDGAPNRKTNGSQETCDQVSATISGTASMAPSGPYPEPASETDSCKTEVELAVGGSAADDKGAPCPDEEAGTTPRKIRSTSESSSRRRDNSPSKRRKSRSKEDVDRSERRTASPDKTVLKRVSSEGRENHRKSSKTKANVDDFLAGAPRHEIKRRNSTGSLDPTIGQVNPSTPSSQVRISQRRTRSPSRARSPLKVSCSPRERSRTKDETLAAHTLHTSPSRTRSLTKSTSSSRDRSKSKTDVSTTKAMHMSLSSLARKPRSPMIRTKSDDKNGAKSLHMSLSGLFERESPPRTRSKSRSLRMSRSNSFSLPEEPKQRSSTHRRREHLSSTKHASDGTTNPSSSKTRRSQSPSLAGREPKGRSTPSSSRLHRNKERSSSLKTPKTVPSRPRRSLVKLQNLPRLSLDDDSGDDDRSINLEMLGVSSNHTTSLQLDISNPCLVETMVVATLLSSNNDDSEAELFDTDLFKDAAQTSAHGSFGRSKSTHQRVRPSKTKSSLMSSLRDLSPRRLRVDRTLEAG